MQLIDWLLVIVPLVAVFIVAFSTRRYVKSVADFLSGGRCAGRYLLANARGESDSGLSNTSAMFEKILISGFVLSFWDKLFYPVILLFGIAGFVIYRFRETRAMTLGQFLEMRYSRPFRLYMGMLAFVSGILNYGIFPGISARFFIYFLDLPQTVHLGPVMISTFSLIMFTYLSFAVFMVVVGGQASTMIADCIEGIFSHLVYIVLAIVVFYIVSWSQIVDVMKASPPGFSRMNPFDASKVSDFNVWFVLMTVFIRLYSTNAMQNKQGFSSAARTAHESRMGGILGEWRGQARALMLLLLCICAITYMNHPAFSQQAVPIHQAIDSVPDQSLHAQMTVPIALRYLLPVGMRGLFCSIMIMGLFAGDTGHLHSWGSIFIQDVVLPLRKKAISPAQHIWILRLAVTGVAAFAFFFSTVFTPTEFINLWWNLTGSMFTAGAGAAIIGGLYWRKGTAPAAWAAAITGSVFAVLGIVLTSFWPGISSLLAPAASHLGLTLPAKFWINQQACAFLAVVIGALVYMITSLLTNRQPFNLDKMLHRGPYAIEADGGQPVIPLRERFRLGNILKFDHNFTRLDKITAGGIFWWAMAMLALNVFITIWNIFSPWPVAWWANYWMWTAVVVPCIIAVITLIWFGIGGTIDMREFFYALRTMKRDARDDGRVAGEHNLIDESPAAARATAAEPAVPVKLTPATTSTP